MKGKTNSVKDIFNNYCKDYVEKYVDKMEPMKLEFLNMEEGVQAEFFKHDVDLQLPDTEANRYQKFFENFRVLNPSIFWDMYIKDVINRKT